MTFLLAHLDIVNPTFRFCCYPGARGGYYYVVHMICFVFAVVFLNNSTQQQPHLSHFLVGRQHINRKFVQMKNFFLYA